MSGFLIMHHSPQSQTTADGSLASLVQHTCCDHVATLQKGTFTVCVASRWQPVEELFLEREESLWIGCGHPMGMEGIHTFREAFASNLCESENWYERLRGHFAVAHLTWESKAITVATNRFGSVPVFWAQGPLGLGFGTQLSACLIATGVSRDIDHTALAEMLVLDAPLRDRTLFEAVRQLPAGSVATVLNSRVDVRKYWHYQFYNGPVKSDVELVGEASRLVKQAISRCVPADRATLLFVSGGLDSRLIAGHALPQLRDARTVSFGVRGSWDLIYGEQVSRRAGSREHMSVEMQPWHYVETSDEGVALTGGMLSAAHFHMYGFVRRHFRPGEVVLTGFLGDPHFGADSRLNRSQPGNPSQAIAAFARRFSLTPDELESLLGTEIHLSIYHDLEQIMDDCVHHNLPSDFDEYYFVAERQSKLIVFISALCNTLEDVRMPFLDYDLASFLCALPEVWRYRRRLQRLIICRDFPELACIPESATGAPIAASRARVALCLFGRKVRRGLQVLIENTSGGRVSTVYPRWPERHTANLRGDLRPWLWNHLELLESRNVFPPNSLQYYRRPFLFSRYDTVRFRLIALEQTLRWCQRWPHLDLH